MNLKFKHPPNRHRGNKTRISSTATRCRQFSGFDIIGKRAISVCSKIKGAANRPHQREGWGERRSSVQSVCRDGETVPVKQGSYLPHFDDSSLPSPLPNNKITSFLFLKSVATVIWNNLTSSRPIPLSTYPCARGRRIGSSLECAF